MAILALSMAALAGHPGLAEAERLSVRRFGQEDGLPGTETRCIVSDRRGFVWFCTSEGLARFDGNTFRTYTTADGLPSRRVTAFLEARDGTYWVGTADGVARFDPRGGGHDRSRTGPLFRAVPGGSVSTPPSRLHQSVFPVQQPHVFALHEDPSGTIWCGTGTGIYRVVLDHGAHRIESGRVAIRPPAAVRAILTDRQGRLWIGAESGLYRAEPDGTVVDFGNEGFLEPGANHNAISSLLESRDGWIWVGTENAGLRLLAPDAVPGPRVWARKWVDVGTGIRHDRAAHVIEADDGAIWWVGLQGLRSLHKGRDAAWGDATLEAVGPADGLPGLEYDRVTEDAAGDLWLAGPTGVTRITRRGFTTFTEADGLDTQAVRAITADRSGAIVAVTERARGAWFHNRFDGRRFSPVRFNIPHDDWGWGWAQLTFHDRQGRWWLPTGQAVYRTDPDVEFARTHTTRFFRFPSPFPPQPFLRNGTLITDFSDNPPELQAWAAFRLFADSRGFVWAGTMQRVGGHDTPNELVRWDPSTDRFSPFPNDDEDFVPMSFAEDRSGAVWIGGYNGGLRRVAPGGVRLEDRSMLVPAGPVQALLVDGRGRLWIGTAEHGLVRVDSPADRPVVGARYGPAQGLSSSDVRALVEDTSGRLYVGHAHGIDVVGGDDAIERSYTSADGLAPGAVWCAFRDETGALWFGTLSGLSRLVPVPGGTPVPTMAVTAVSVGGQPLGISEVGEQSVVPFEVPPEAPAIRIAYAALGRGSPADVRYQVRLEGADTDWSAPLSRQSAEFTRLAPGSYRFLVRAVSPSGSVLSDVGVVPFTVLRPIWARWWSVALLSLAVVALLYALHQTRVARAIAVERVRLRLARDLHDELGSNLSRLAILGDVAQRDPARVSSVLSDVSATARRLMDALSDVVWFVDPRHDDLASVIDLVAAHGRDLFEPLGVAWTCLVPDDATHVRLAADTRRELYLILKEAVTNAARHAGCAHASLDVRLEAGTVIATVSDDGRGFDTADAASNGSSGNGLRNMRARAAAIGATLDVSASPAGTAVHVTLRLR